MEETNVHGVAVASGLTVEDVWAIPDDGMRRELIDGELFVSPSPKLSHQHVLGNVYRAVVEAAGGRRVYFAPLDVVMGTRTVVQPDLVAFSTEDSADLDPDGPHAAHPVPELVIEVSSPSTWRVDVVRKRRLYERMGVAEYWFVDREAEVVDVYAFGAEDDLRTSSGDDPIRSDLVALDATVEELLAW
jgi:Uma2 family endonuclease